MAITITISDPDLRLATGANQAITNAVWIAATGAVGSTLGEIEIGTDTITDGEITITVTQASTAYYVRLKDPVSTDIIGLFGPFTSTADE